MNYNDFPILDSIEYEILNEHFHSNQSSNRRQLASSTQQMLESLLNSDITKNRYNNKILSALQNNLSILQKLNNNLSALFSRSTISNKTYNMDLFQYLNKLISLTQNLFKWSNKEQKEYYKTFLQKTIFELLNSLSNILSTAEQSNVLFFKHM